MRAYVMNDAQKALVELQAAEAKRFTDRFFGRAEPPEISKEIIEKKTPFDNYHKEYTV